MLNNEIANCKIESKSFFEIVDLAPCGSVNILILNQAKPLRNGLVYISIFVNCFKLLN